MIPYPEVRKLCVCGSRGAARNLNCGGFIVTFLRCNYLISSQPGDVYCKLHILTLKMIRIAALTWCFIVRQQSICSSLRLLVSLSSLLCRHGWVSRLSPAQRYTLIRDKAASHRSSLQTRVHVACLCVQLQLYVLPAVVEPPMVRDIVFVGSNSAMTFDLSQLIKSAAFFEEYSM